jgi:hypothetical protein
LIYEVHRKAKNNVGDYYCNPSRYFKFPDVTSGELMSNGFPITGQTLVVGGGGLIHKKFNQHIDLLIKKKPKNTVIWGIGHNFGRKAISKGINYYPEYLKQCQLVGIRDWIDGHYKTYLPCVSCMHPAFNETYEVKHDIVYFTHAAKTKYNGKDCATHMNNSTTDFNKVIKFLGSANTVVTDSYHGAYWAQLLGKNVQVVNWSVKFNHMKHAPIMLESINSKIKTYNNRIPEFLEECQELNNAFYQKFLNLL